MERLSLKLIQDISGLVDEFCKDCSLRGMTAETVRRYRSSLLAFAKFMMDKGLTIREVDNSILRSFLNYIIAKNVKYKTMENYFSAISAFYDYLAFEGLTDANIILPFRRRYLRRYKNDCDDPERKLLSVEEMSKLVNSIMDPRDKAIAILFAKTGIRRGELLKLDIDDVNWRDYSIKLKPTPKRSNRMVFFDDECAVGLRWWLSVRKKLRR